MGVVVGEGLHESDGRYENILFMLSMIRGDSWD